MAYERHVFGTAATAELIALFKQELAMCNLAAGEHCMIVTDTAFDPVIADSFMGAAFDMGAEVSKLVVPHSVPPPMKTLRPAWKEVDLLVYPTTHTLHSQPAMRE